MRRSSRLPSSAIRRRRRKRSKKAASPRTGKPSPPNCARRTATRAGRSSSRRPKPAEGDAKRVDIAIPAFGYKNHIGIDRAHGLIRTWRATHAARHDGAELPGLIDNQNTASDVWADTAYRSAKNEEHLARNGLRSPPAQEAEGQADAGGHRKSQREKVQGSSRVEHVFARQKGPMALVIRTI